MNCLRCGSKAVIGNGRRPTKQGDVPRFLCKACGYRFVEPRFSDYHVALALDLFFRGLSLRKVSAHLREAHGVEMSATTIFRFVMHYGQLAAEWMDAQDARTGKRWHVDETVVSVDGQRHYVWNVLDADTRFLLATHVSRNRSMTNTRAPLRKAKAATAGRPREVFTDGMMAYPAAVSKELGRRNGGSWLNPHRRVPSIKARPSNNRIERFHGTERAWLDVRRGVGAAAPGLLEGFRAHYNLVQRHEKLRRTPAEAAGLPGLGRFRWLTLIQTLMPPE